MTNLTLKYKQDIISACNQRDIKNVFVEDNGNDSHCIRILFYSGSMQTIICHIDKQEAQEFIKKVYEIKENVLMDKHKDLLI